MQRDSGSAKFPIGSELPPFLLPNVNGSTLDNRYFDAASLSLVVFACNHCPYVIGSEKMLFDTIREFEGQGVKSVIISSNDPIQYPEDSFEKMQQYAKVKDIPCPYLFDETQEVARSFDAQCTPECFLFNSDKKLIYHGTINNSPRYPEQVNTNFLEIALSQACSGKNPEPSFVHPIGCSIKWKN